MYVWRIKLFDDCRRLEHANNQITANNFAQDWYFSQGGTFGTNYYCTSHLSLCVGGPQPVSRVDSCLAKRGKEYDLQHCYIEWSRSRLLKYDFFLFRIHLRKRRKEEEHKHGIFFDDDYDYLQHVKPRTNPTLEPLPVNISVMEAKKLSGPLHIQVFLQIAWLLWMKAYNLQHCHTANAWIFSWGSCNYQVRYLDPDMNSQKACSTLLHHHTVILHFLVDIRFS